MRKRHLSVWGWLIALVAVGLVVSAIVPGLKVVFIACAVIGGVVILGAFAGGSPTTATGENRAAMVRGLPYTGAGEEAARRYAERHRGD